MNKKEIPHPQTATNNPPLTTHRSPSTDHRPRTADHRLPLAAIGRLMVLFFFVALFYRGAAATQVTADGNALPLARLLNGDGTLRLESGYAGAIDPAGYEMVLDDNNRPAFAPTAATAGVNNGQWDTLFGKPGVEVGFSGSGINAMAVDSQGRVYVGGDFVIAGSKNVLSLAMWDGSEWQSVGRGVNNDVYALAVDAADNLYVGGSLSQVTNPDGSTLSANRIARWDGTAWSLLGADEGAGGNGVGGNVYAIAVDGSGQVYVGGQFITTYNAGGSSVSANRVARWDGAAWNALGADSGTTGNGFNTTVRALAISGSLVYAGGDFTTAYESGSSSVSANRVAAWDTGSGAWSALGAGSGTTGNGLSATVLALVVAGNGDLYAGGSFGAAYDDAGTTISALRLARWDGTSWSGSAVSTGVNSTVRALALDGNTLYAGGNFTRIQVDNRYANYVVSYDISGGTWATLGSDQNPGGGRPYGNGVDRPIWAMAAGTGTVYAGGVEGPTRAFNSLSSSVGVEAVVAWESSAGQWQALGNGQTQGATSGSQGVRALAVDGQGRLYVGGDFDFIGNRSANNIAMWDGTNWSQLGADTGDEGNGVDGTVYALAVDAADNLYVGGSFNNAYDGTSLGTVAARNVARWDGSSWAELGSGGFNGNGTNGPVYALAAAGSGNLYVGGNFTLVCNGGTCTGANYIARWDGTDWFTLGSDAGTGGNGVNNIVRALALSGSDLYVGGQFTTAYNNLSSSLNAGRIARWDGTAWHALGGGVSSSVFALLAVGGDLYVGGQFFQADGNSANRIARWDGTAWYPLGNGGGNNGNGVSSNAVNALALSKDGRSLLVGGSFTTAYNDIGDSVTANRFASWDLTHGGWTAFGGGLNETVYAVQPQGYYNWVSGTFIKAENRPSTYIGRWLVLSDLSLRRSVMANSGAPAAGTTLQVNSTLGQSSPIGPSGGVSSTLRSGYWIASFGVQGGAVAPTLTITVSNSVDVVLNWTTSPDNCAYAVYSSASPYFDTGTGFLEAGNLPAGTSQYTDAGAAGSGLNKYYLVEATGCGGGTAVSNEVGLFFFPIVPGS